jgi:polysaccharide pyruvyl transferase CsaB
MARAPRILISGWYGNGNLGDEAVLAGMLGALGRALPEARVAVLSDDPAATERQHRVRAFGRDNASPRRRLLSELRAAARHDALVIGGGGLVKDYGEGPGNVHAWVRPGLLARRLRKRTMWYAMGVDEIRFPASRRVARRAGERVAVLSVRDEGSARRLRATGLEREPLVSADPALLLGPANEAGRNGAAIAVCPRRWKAAADDVAEPELERRLWRELAAALDALVEREDVHVLLVPFSQSDRDDDREACRAILGLMQRRDRSRLLPVPGSPEEALATLAECGLVVGTRLHSLILGAAAGVPFHALDYMPKVGAFAERSGLAGERSGLDVASEPGALGRRLESAWRGRGALAERLRRVLPPLRGLARLDGELLADLVTGGRRLPALAAESRALDGQVRAARGG